MVLVKVTSMMGDNNRAIEGSATGALWKRLTAFIADPAVKNQVHASSTASYSPSDDWQSRVSIVVHLTMAVAQVCVHLCLIISCLVCFFFAQTQMQWSYESFKQNQPGGKVSDVNKWRAWFVLDLFVAAEKDDFPAVGWMD